MNSRFDWTILEAINNAFRAVKAAPLVLGGVVGSGGGGGGPVGGYVGHLPQTRVAYDLSELASSGTPASGMSLLDNLNHIRYRLGVVEASGAGAITFLDLTDTPATYSGHAGQMVVVNQEEDGLQFIVASGVTGASSAAIQTDQTGGTSDTYGVLAGDVDGVNTVFTVSKAVYVIGMLHVYLNGQLQTQGTGQDWVETSPTTGTFTFAVAPPTGSEITAIYTYSVNVAADGSLVITYDGDDVDTVAKTIGGDTVTTTYDFARNGSNQITQIDKTIGAVTQRKTLTWTGDKVTATSVWVTL